MIKKIISICCFITTLSIAAAASPIGAAVFNQQQRSGIQNSAVVSARGILERLIPDRAASFVLESIPPENGSDVFEIESKGDKIIIRGSTGVSIASGLNWYLKYYCNCLVSWCGDQVYLPDVLPEVQPKLRRVTSYKYRYMFNYCTFGYSMPWWDWQQWERQIDWMALNGVNMPLAVTGQEAIWQIVLSKLGLTEKEITAFLAGPPYLPFGWMGCLDGWGGPLPQSWIKSHIELEKRILARERELGMMPVLQGFTGHIPSSLKEKFPRSKTYDIKWVDWETTFLDPLDPLFKKIGKMFVDEEIQLFGTNHLYASDSFIEMTPPRNEPSFLSGVGKAIFGAMNEADPKAVWIMQGWAFYFQRKFWGDPQIEALLNAVPNDNMILLDLYSEVAPQWEATNGYFGKPWVWCMLMNFGGNIQLHGDMPAVNRGPAEARFSPKGRKISGLGMTLEGFGVNTIMFDLLTEMTWRTQPVKLDEWVRDYARHRYGVSNFEAEAAWEHLRNSVYQGTYYTRSRVVERPSLELQKEMPYDNSRLIQAWKNLIDCADKLGIVDTYQFDLVNVTRQVLSNVAGALHRNMVAAYNNKDQKALDASSARFLQLIRDLDELLGTRKEFLLGTWLEDAKRWGTNEEEKNIFEWNARNVITLWSGGTSLNEYAQKEWSGLLKGFYLQRWIMFCGQLKESLSKGIPLDQKAFVKKSLAWEQDWVKAHDAYTTEPAGSSVEIAMSMFKKYSGLVK